MLQGDPSVSLFMLPFSNCSAARKNCIIALCLKAASNRFFKELVFPVSYWGGEQGTDRWVQPDGARCSLERPAQPGDSRWTVAARPGPHSGKVGQPSFWLHGAQRLSFRSMSPRWAGQVPLGWKLSLVQANCSQTCPRFLGEGGAGSSKPLLVLNGWLMFGGSAVSSFPSATPALFKFCHGSF